VLTSTLPEPHSSASWRTPVSREAADLQVGDIDFLWRTIHVQRRIHNRVAGLDIIGLKHGSERVVPVPGELVQRLSRARGRAVDVLSAAVSDRPTPLLLQRLPRCGHPGCHAARPETPLRVRAHLGRARCSRRLTGSRALVASDHPRRLGANPAGHRGPHSRAATALMNSTDDSADDLRITGS